MKLWRPSGQLFFGFFDGQGGAMPKPKVSAPPEAVPVPEDTAVPIESSDTENPLQDGRDANLEAEARQWLTDLGLHEGSLRLQVKWNSRLRSTAGYAHWPQWTVELNPKLSEFEGQVMRTLKHEVAHLVAYARAGRKRIEPHGVEWQLACDHLGIPGESARHTLPLPRSQRERKFIYQCPGCHTEVGRVLRFKRHSACLACCRKHNGGRYDPRFQFQLIRQNSEN